MWFGLTQGELGPTERILLLAASNVALVALVQIWAVRGTSPWWMRWGAVAAIAALLMHIGAPELVLFLEGNLIAIIATTRAAVVRWPPGGLATRRFELQGIGILLTVEAAFALLAD